MFYLARKLDGEMQEVTHHHYRSSEAVKEEFKRMYRNGGIKAPRTREYFVMGEDGEAYFIFTGMDGAGRMRWAWYGK